MNGQPREELSTSSAEILHQLRSATPALHALVHEMRSQMQTILSSLDFLDGEQLPGGSRAVGRRLHRSAAALECHIADLATLLLIQSGDYVMLTASFEVGAILEEVRVLSAHAGVEISVQELAAPIFAQSDPVIVRAMLLRLARAFGKLSAAGCIALSLRDQSSANSSICFVMQCVNVASWPCGFGERLLPVKALAQALGGTLDDTECAMVVLTLPTRIEKAPEIASLIPPRGTTHA